MQIEGGEQRRLTVAQYFEERYGKLQFPKLPCLHVGPPLRHIYFPIEVCEVEWPMKMQKKLNDKQTAAVIRVRLSSSIREAFMKIRASDFQTAAVDAPTREQKILTLAKSAGYERDPFLKEFGIQMNLRMVEMTARVIPAPQILYNEHNRSRTVCVVFRLLFSSNSSM